MRTAATRRSIQALVLCGMLAACGREETQPAAPAPAPAAAPAQPAGFSLVDAEKLYVELCAQCHGARGAGNGMRATEVQPPPRNFQDPDWQRSFDDAYIERIIVEGGAALGKSADMPAHPELRDHPERVTGLRRFIRTLAE
jgi:mono/diheme cytochrome c family protein